ncbi:hypothetical protein D3C83_276470 [compost metagenome]
MLEPNLNGTSLDTPAEVLALAVEFGGNTTINLGGANAITLIGTPLASLSVANFAFIEII